MVKKNKQSYISAFVGVIAVIAFAVFDHFKDNSLNASSAGETVHVENGAGVDNGYLRQVIAQSQSGTMVLGEGRVIKVLADDLDGSAHQRFIIELPSGETILIAHNIDLAPRLAGITENDIVTFKGQYEANNRGGVIHWTHKDPNGSHEGGWIEYKGKRYQ